MKLLNHSLQYLSIFILIVITLWSGIFYIDFRDEVYDIVDDGLEDQLKLLNARVRENPALLQATSFETGMFSITPISYEEALVYQEEVFSNTLMPLPYDNDLEQVRMLSEAYLVGDQYYKYQVISSTVEEDDLVESLVVFIIWLYASLMLTVFLVNNWALKTLWAPFYQVLRELKQFRVEKQKPLSDISSRAEEFQELKNVADELTKRAARTFIQQKQFIENASHELQTPIAIIQSKLELLLENASMNNEDAAVVGEVLEISSRLNQLNKSLLLLSKIDNKQFSKDEPVSVNTIMKHITESFEEICTYKSVSVQLSEPEPCSVHADTYLIEILLRNLLQNAVRHNKEGGFVKLHITANELKICNTSEAGALDQSRLFKRFSGNKATGPGTGLGLAIAYAVCEMYGYTLRYSYESPKHCFKIMFY